MAAASGKPLLSDDDRPSVVKVESVLCSITAMRLELEKRNDGSAEVFSAWVADRSLSAASIERTLRKKGLHLRAGNISRHRAGDCKCPRV